MTNPNQPKDLQTVASPNRILREVTLVCTYDVDSPNLSEAAALNTPDPASPGDSFWNPATDDFMAVARTPNGKLKPEVIQIQNVSQFIEKIVNDSRGKPRTPRSVARVNIIGHGSPGLIGLRGTVYYRSSAYQSPTDPDDAGNVRFGDENTADYLNAWGFGRATAQWLSEKGDGSSYGDQIRNVLTSDAEIALILCHSGQLDGGYLMKTMARVFHAKVFGYMEAIFYHPKFNVSPRVRNRTSVGRQGTVGLGYRCWLPAPLDGKHLEYTAHESPPSK